MIKWSLKETLRQNPIVAAIKNDDELEKCIKSSVSVVFVLYGTILNIAKICSKLKNADKIIFIHIDLIDGLKADQSGIEFIKQLAQPDGIITTKSPNVRYAKQLGLKTIQRLFVIDSLSLNTGIKNIHDTNPTAIEVMPGIASEIIESLTKQTNIPIIAGGLVKTQKNVINALNAGAIAISTTTSELWGG